ncbi:hypothetical protein HFO56_24815 [Rhizobium laguerreae]|uniref:hypothetical protein n=1 Tax=Rhizobium laguerreae TaxID=1076926 RepID=UPI001C9079DC|nr:hypothetical protein [Rhizobium laguerreae]MBY3155552.1 hypothetical protein [Rhizobium laguerreae]
MDGAVKERLENQAFMATVVRTGGPGIGVAEWMEFVATSVRGYIGDVLFDIDSEPWRVVLALSDGPLAPNEQGADLPVSVAGALNARLAEIKDIEAGATLGEIAALLRSRFLAGGALECSVAADGVSLDFTRGRHMISDGRNLMALHVHGMTALGTSYSPQAVVVSVYPDGICELRDGSRIPFSEVGEVEEGKKGDVAIAVPQRQQAALSPLAARIARSSAGSMQGPEPTGMILSRGEDGRVMLVLKTELPKGKLSVRFLPAAIQLVVDGDVAAQSGFGEVAEILGWLEDSTVEVCVINDGDAKWSKAAVEIRTSA